MDLKSLSRGLTRLYNNLGNKYLTDNFVTEPFEFDVNVRKGDRHDDYQHFIIEVNTDRKLPSTFAYKKQKEGRIADGIHNSVLAREFKEYVQAIDPNFRSLHATVGVKFLNKEK